MHSKKMRIRENSIRKTVYFELDKEIAKDAC